ncbi:MAG TPA: YbjN domain-containing protein [Anaerolineaceae bacterium]|nr:YbjN domain-containing protein [Anaerolineaceae bacterium]HPN51580.1 YbjN domain-containing protein [Anaerolineaceae bacterium]
MKTIQLFEQPLRDAGFAVEYLTAKDDYPVENLMISIDLDGLPGPVYMELAYASAASGEQESDLFAEFDYLQFYADLGEIPVPALSETARFVSAINLNTLLEGFGVRAAERRLIFRHMMLCGAEGAQADQVTQAVSVIRFSLAQFSPPLHQAVHSGLSLDQAIAMGAFDGLSY